MQAEKEAQRTARLAEMSTSTTVTLSTLATVDEDQEALQRMNLIVKADASGSLEAIKGALRALPQDSVALRFLLAATGPITPSDVDLAHSSGALIMGAAPPRLTCGSAAQPSTDAPGQLRCRCRASGAAVDVSIITRVAAAPL